MRREAYEEGPKCVPRRERRLGVGGGLFFRDRMEGRFFFRFLSRGVDCLNFPPDETRAFAVGYAEGRVGQMVRM